MQKESTLQAAGLYGMPYLFLFFLLLLVLGAFFVLLRRIERRKRMLLQEIAKWDLSMDHYDIKYKERQIIYQAKKNAYHQRMENEYLWCTKEEEKNRKQGTLRNVIFYQNQKQERYRQLCVQSKQVNDKYIPLLNQLEAVVWSVDTHGEVTLYNQKLANTFQPIYNNLDNLALSDILDGNANDLSVYETRDFNNVINRFRLRERAEAYISTRIIKNGSTLSHILFSAERDRYETELIKTYQNIIRNLNFINEIGQFAIKNRNSDDYLQAIIEKIGEFGHLNSLSLRLKNMDNPDKLSLYTSYSNNQEYIKHSDYEIKGTHMGMAFTSGEKVIINGPSDLSFPEPQLTNVFDKQRGIAYIPLKIGKESIGVLSLIQEQSIDPELIMLLDSVVINITIALERIILYDELKNDYYMTIEAFVTASEVKYSHFKGHAKRVAMITKILAEKLFFDPEELDALYMSALLHDIGKIAFDDDSDLYHKDEVQHCQIGKAIASRIGFDKLILDGIEYHHSDYQMKGKIQPIYAQFIRIANEFDHYVTSAPTKEQISRFINHLRSKGETVYSQQIVNILAAIPPGELLRLYHTT